MTDLPALPAARLARARWRDTRLVAGVLLVLLSVVVGAKVVAQADDTVPVWQVTHDLGAGAVLERDDLTVRDVHLPDGAVHYVAAAGAPPAGYVLVRPLGADELLPRRAIATASTARLRRLSVPVDAVAAQDLAAKAVVDIYVVPAADGVARSAGATARPTPQARLVLAEVTVADVSRRGSGLGGSGGADAVTLLVTPAQASRILDAQATGELRLLVKDLSPEPATAAGP